MKETLLYIAVLIMASIASYQVFSAAIPTKYMSQSYDAQAVVIYGYTSANVLTPVLVNSGGAIVTTNTP